MKQFVQDRSLPEPVTLSPEQLVAVASDTSAMLGAGGGRIIIYGGFPIGPVISMATTATVAVSTPTAI